MKKIASALLLSAMVTSAYATTSTATGFYLGANLGGSNTNAKYTLSNNNDVASGKTAGTAAGAAVAKPISEKIDAGKLGAVFGAFAGYGYQMGQGYIGAELFFNGETSDVKVRDASWSEMSIENESVTDDYVQSPQVRKFNVKKKMGYGFALRAGMFVTPSTLAYIKLGLEGGKYSAKADNTGSKLTITGQPDEDGDVVDITDNAATTADFVKEKKKNAMAFAPGVGLEAFINKNMFVRAEFTHVFGPKIKFDQNKDTYALSDVSTQYRHEVKVTQNRFTIGLGYKF
ncbi:MAG: hypothetical protein C0432_01295 [Candidatus Puniceispirillum sp.]|nr:hypothetical protein [Candidatus Pelagibacter sp.]MBA4282916.1 hypothetical protein [Candidatus Puniceispirillum sp.]